MTWTAYIRNATLPDVKNVEPAEDDLSVKDRNQFKKAKAQAVKLLADFSPPYIVSLSGHTDDNGDEGQPHLTISVAHDASNA